MSIEKSLSGLYWVVMFRGQEIARCQRKYQAREQMHKLVKLV